MICKYCKHSMKFFLMKNNCILSSHKAIQFVDKVIVVKQFHVLWRHIRLICLYGNVYFMYVILNLWKLSCRKHEHKFLYFSDLETITHYYDYYMVEDLIHISLFMLYRENISPRFSSNFEAKAFLKKCFFVIGNILVVLNKLINVSL